MISRSRSQQILVQLQSVRQICRARLFLAFENDFQIHFQRNLFRAQRVERGKQRHDRRFVVGSRSRINPPVVFVDRRLFRAVLRKRNAFSPGFNRIGSQDRRERRAVGPCGGIDRLAIVVRVENHRVRGLRR